MQLCMYRMNILHIFTFLALVLILPPNAVANISGNSYNVTVRNGQVKDIIGAIVDSSSRIGKEEQVAMEMAVQDFNDFNNQSMVLHIRHSNNEPVSAVLAATDLINMQHAQAILGLHTWEEVSAVAKVNNERKIPVLSFADSTPEWATERWPFLVCASPNIYAQTEAIAAIVKSCEWNQVTLIYEDNNDSSATIITHLSSALREKDAEIVDFIALPPFASFALVEELTRLQKGQCRVFVVHLSLPTAVSLFEIANKMQMMEKDYVWITTDAFTSLVHSIDVSTISSMQGILGVKRYFPENGSNFKDFYSRFRKNFSLKHPEEDNPAPGIYAVQAYDAVWTLCKAMKVSKNGSQELLEIIVLSNFHGLTGKVQFVTKKAVPAHIFQIINVMGRSYRDLGFWSDEFGFSKSIDYDNASYNPSMEGLGQVFWPGGPRNTPRGWTLSTSAKPLRIGVPTRSLFKQYVNVECGDLKNGTSYCGVAIELFEAIVKELPFYLTYNFCRFDGSYDLLVKQIQLQRFDAVVGDIAITAKRYQDAEFTPPYTEAGLVMAVPLQSKSRSKQWLFIKPFTKALWILIVISTIYTIFVVWIIERNHNSELTGSALKQTGTFLCFSFTTIFPSQGTTLNSNLSRIVMAVWLSVTLVIMQTYTANLASILTIQRLEPTVSSIESLQNSNAMIGYNNASFVSTYLVDVLRFSSRNIKGYNSTDEYAKDLKNKEIAAMFLEAPSAKLFLAKYCKGFTIVGPTYKVGGYGFAFPRGSQLLLSITEALLKVSESGKLREIENSMLASENCVTPDLDDEISSLSPINFCVLFLFTGATSTIALIIYQWKAHRFNNFVHTTTLWTRMVVAVKGHLNRWTFRRVSGVENHKDYQEDGTANMRIGNNIGVPD